VPCRQFGCFASQLSQHSIALCAHSLSVVADATAY
jgi:hypothetical protein